MQRLCNFVHTNIFALKYNSLLIKYYIDATYVAKW